MTSPTTIRIPKEILQELDERCEKLNCTRNEYIKNSIEFALDGSSEFDFGDVEYKIQEIKVQSDEEKFKPHYDKYGNYWAYDKDMQKWICHFNMDNVKITK